MHIITCPIYTIVIFTQQSRKIIGCLHSVGKPVFCCPNISKGGQVKACGTCSEARGIIGLALIEGVEISTMSQLTLWSVESDKVITF
jgi:hypothetical protein